MLLATLVDVTLPATNGLRIVVDFIGSPVVALLLSLVFAFYSFGFARGYDKNDLLKFTNDCLGPVASIILIIGAGGGFNKILIASGVSDAIAKLATGAHISPLKLAFVIAGII